MLNFHKDHRSLVTTALFVFVGLSMLVAVIPAYQMQKTQPLPSMEPMDELSKRGLEVYVEENCMACHTQQVRGIEMDEVWGDRPSLASDYFYSKKRLDFWRQSPSLLGSERTGPDLTNVGKRQPGAEWHLMHLYNPRIVVKESIMPSYSWLFDEKDTSQITEEDVVVLVPPQYLNSKSKKVVATAKAMELVHYLQSLQQAPLPNETTVEFIPSRKKDATESKGGKALVANGGTLFKNTCAACHQENGQGIEGAFPALAGSGIVNDPNPETLLWIILKGYDARTEYGVMPGFGEQLTDEEIAAIANHERSSWGNDAPAISVEDVAKVREYVNELNPK